MMMTMTATATATMTMMMTKTMMMTTIMIRTATETTMILTATTSMARMRMKTTTTTMPTENSGMKIPYFFITSSKDSLNMTILSPRLALNLNDLLSCCIVFCCSARAKPCHTTPPLSCHATVSLLALRLSCAGWLLHRLLSCCATISLAQAVC